MKVLLIAPNVDATDVGEALMAFKWAEALSTRVQLTVLCFQRPGRPDVAAQLPNARVVTWPEPAWAMRHERLNAMLKPAWPVFARHVRRWIETALRSGEGFDITHQLMPQAARYASPLRHFDLPYIIGPLGGALDTPDAFRAEVAGAPVFTRLRALDDYRFRHDPWLRQSYTRAACVLGVAPYVETVLGDIPLRRFESVLELGADDVAPARPRPEPGRLARSACRSRGPHQGPARHGPRAGASGRSAGRDADQRGRGRGSGRLSGRGRAAGRRPSRQRSWGASPAPRSRRSTPATTCSAFPPSASPRAASSTRRCATACRSSPPTVADRDGSWTTPAASGAGHRPRRLSPPTSPMPCAGWPPRRAFARRSATARAPRCGGRGCGRQRPIASSISMRTSPAIGMRGRLYEGIGRPVRNSRASAFCAVTSML
jgi:hypothetical protein